MTIREAKELYWRTVNAVCEGEALKAVRLTCEEIQTNRRKAENALMQKSKEELVQYILYEHQGDF
jgi:hypothetical protein